MATVNRKAFRNQLLYGMCDAFNALTIGCAIGYPSSALLSMYKDPNFEVTEEQGNWIGAIVPAMALFGSLVSKISLEMLGRKNSMLFISTLVLLTWIAISKANTIYQVIMARLLVGACIGMQQVVMAVFVSETIHPKLRPLFGTLPAIAGSLGCMLVNIVPESVAGWRSIALLGAMLTVPLIITTIIVSESPFYLLKSEKRRKALEVLLELREFRQEAEKEFGGIEQNAVKVVSNKKSNLGQLFLTPNKWSVSMALSFHIFQPLTGYITLCTFMGLLLEKSASYVDLSTTSFITNMVNIIVVLSTPKLPSLYSRKQIIKWSSQIMFLSNFLLGCYLFLRERNLPYADALSLIPFLSFLFAGIGFQIGWGPIPWMFIGDGVPLKIRGDVASLATAVNWGFNFIVSKAFSIVASYLGYSSLLFFYAFSTFAGNFVIKWYLPETFGFTPGQIDTFYENSYSLQHKEKKKKPN